MPKPHPVVFSVDWNACIRCGACVAVCPQAAGFTTPFDTIAVDTPCDIACMACEKICPVTAIAWRAAIPQHGAHPERTLSERSESKRKSNERAAGAGSSGMKA